jgi:hypothetical protein
MHIIRLIPSLYLVSVVHSNLECLRKTDKLYAVVPEEQIVFVAWTQKHDLWDVRPCSLVNDHDVLEEHAAFTLSIEEKTEH